MAELRRAEAGCDWGNILDLLQDSFAYMEGRIAPASSLHRLSRESIARFASQQHLVIAEAQDMLIGCVFLTSREDHLYLGKLAVHHAFRHQGIARQLVSEAKRVAAEKGLNHLQLETRIELTENHAAFERLGFVKIAETSHPGFTQPTSITMQMVF